MSGPIIRKYGFPNFEQIFGKRDLEHGVAEPSAEKSDQANAQGAGTQATPTNPASPPETSKSAEKG